MILPRSFFSLYWLYSVYTLSYPVPLLFWHLYCLHLCSGSLDPHILFSANNIFRFQAMSLHDQVRDLHFPTSACRLLAIRLPVAILDPQPPHRERECRAPSRTKIECIEDIFFGHLVRSQLFLLFFVFIPTIITSHITFVHFPRWLGSFLVHHVNRYQLWLCRTTFLVLFGSVDNFDYRLSTPIF